MHSKSYSCYAYKNAYANGQQLTIPLRDGNDKSHFKKLGKLLVKTSFLRENKTIPNMKVWYRSKKCNFGNLWKKSYLAIYL